MPGKSGITRRQFVQRASAVTAGAFAIPTIIPSSALGQDGATAPSERLTLGCIGLGGMGMGNMGWFLGQEDVQVVAVCDVDSGATRDGQGRDAGKRRVEEHYGQQAGRGYKGCTAYTDFRELLAHEDVDLVCVATPDHWHALISVAAANAGKHVYCEKPLANSIGEGRAICKAVNANRVVLQTGSHERSNPNVRYACELVRNGRIGDLKTIRVNLPCSDGHHQQARQLTSVPPAEPIPDCLDWDFWLGHTPMRDYSGASCHFWWRFILAHGGGEMTDRGAHVIDLAQLGAGMDDTGPVHIEATGVQTPGGLYDTYWDYSFVNTYANGLEMIGSTDEPRGLRFEGSDGWIFIHVHGGALEASRPSLLEEKIGDDEIQLGRTPDHHRNFLDCVKSGERPFACAEIGHRTATICHLNNLAMKLGRPLEWDPVMERVKDDPAANALLTPQMRAPWKV